jgi:hypothetical protein
MKKLLASAAVAVALLLPAASAYASEIPSPAGVDDCPAGSVGRIVWRYDYLERQYYYYKFCIYTGP